MIALDIADLIAELLRDKLPVATVDDARQEGPLFAKLFVRGGYGDFAVTVEQLIRPGGVVSDGDRGARVA